LERKKTLEKKELQKEKTLEKKELQKEKTLEKKEAFLVMRLIAPDFKNY